MIFDTNLYVKTDSNKDIFKYMWSLFCLLMMIYFEIIDTIVCFFCPNKHIFIFSQRYITEFIYIWGAEKILQLAKKHFVPKVRQLRLSENL